MSTTAAISSALTSRKRKMKHTITYERHNFDGGELTIEVDDKKNVTVRDMDRVDELHRLIGNIMVYLVDARRGNTYAMGRMEADEVRTSKIFFSAVEHKIIFVGVDSDCQRYFIK